MDYQLELKQIVAFPRCRIYREFIQNLIKDKNIRTKGDSYLFYFIVLCTFANYRSSRKKIDGITYTVSAGEWILSIAELQDMFRFRFKHQVLTLLNYLKEQNYITYTVLGKNKLVKYQIAGWQNDNTALPYSYPCKKDAGFFFFPVAKVHELISIGKCSEMDVVLDLWIHAIYNDTQVQGSEVGPVVYFRNNTGNPLTNYSELASRWGISKASVCRMLKKLDDQDYLSLVSFKGNNGSVIYLNGYLSTMFNISDVMIDKEAVALSLSLSVHVPEDTVPEPDTAKQTAVPENDTSVPESHMKFIIGKVSQLLDTQGIPCCHCDDAEYQLSKLSDCKGILSPYSLSIICPHGDLQYRFEMTVAKQDAHAQEDAFLQVPNMVLKVGSSHEE